MVATIYQDSEGVRKQVSIDNYAVSKIMDMTESGASTKGLIAYEMLMLTTPEYTDPYSSIEDRLFSELEQYYNREVREFFEANQMASGNKKSVLKDLELACRYDDAHERMRNSNFYFPESFLESNIDGRGLGDEIASALVTALACPYDDRLERSEIVINLIELAEGSTESTDNKHAYVSELLSASAMSTDSLESEIGGIIAETLSLDTDDEYHDVKPRDVTDMVIEDEMPNSKMDRIELVETAINNSHLDRPSVTVLVRDDLEQTVSDMTGYKDRTVREYVGRIMDRDNLIVPVYDTPKDAIADVDSIIDTDEWIDNTEVLSHADDSLRNSPACEEFITAVVEHNDSITR